jgi:hypothetical protein
MLAHFFLWRLKIKMGKKAPALTIPQARALLAVVFPVRNTDILLAIELVRWIQARNHRAYLSHRRKRILCSGVPSNRG